MCVFEKSPVAVLEENVFRWLDGQPIILFALTCFSFSQESYLVNPPLGCSMPSYKATSQIAIATG